MMNWNKILSSLLAVSYVTIGYLNYGAKTACEVGMFALLPLTCIWFADAMGGYVGPVWRGNITAASPGTIVYILGWLVLLLPGIAWVL